MSDALTVLLVEDNPGDARLIEEMLAEREGLPGPTDDDDDGLELRHAARLEEAIEALGGQQTGDVGPDRAGATATGRGRSDDANQPARIVDAGEQAPASDGSTSAPDGAPEASDGSPGAPDGASEAPDGSPGAPDGASGAPDGSPGAPDGPSEASDGSQGARGEPASAPIGAAGAPDHDVDVVLLDLNLPDSTGLETLAAVVEATGLLPIIVLTGVSDREIGIEAIERGAQDYLVKDEVSGGLLVRSIRYALERSRQERERARRREQLEALNRHNRIAQDVTHAVITSATREELERTVCDRLAAPDAYRFAWIGEVDRRTSQVTPRVTAGAEAGYLDEVTITADDAETADGPTGTAVATSEVRVVDDVATDPGFDPWRQAALDREYRSSAAVPIVHEELTYGVLNVYASEPFAFSEPEVEILERLGHVVGHAISALERKDALVRDTTLELEFRVQGFARPLVAATTEHDATVAFDSLIRTDDAVLAYGRVEGLPQERFRAATDEMDAVEDCRILRGTGERYDVEVVTTAGEALFEAVPTHGGQIRSATVDDGAVGLVVEFPHGRDTRKLTALVTEHCPGATLQAQRTREHDDEEAPTLQSLDDDRLTEKQLTALQTSYHAGHFEWPRETSGEELAERLGVSPATFHEHLRSAERKIFEQVFEGE